MKKLMTVAFICFNAITIFAQTQKYDIMTFTPPKGWSVENGGNAKVYTKVDKAKNTLGIIMLYPSIDSSGDANEDFKYVWKQIVQDSFGGTANPETEMAESDGFKVVNGGEMIKYEGIQALAMLTVLSGKGKVVSILTITNDQSYVQSTQAMIESMTIDAKAATNQPPKSTNNSNENTGSNFTGDTGSYKFTTPPNWSAQRSSSEITLKNGNNIISMLSFVKSSGNLEADANRIMFEVFNGWVPWTENGFKADHADLEKGKTIQGFNYFSLKKMINKSGDIQVRMDAIILLVEVGGNVAVIAGTEPFQEMFGETSKALDYILFDLSFSTGKTQTYNLKSELLGEWTMLGGGVGSSYKFNPDGTYLWSGATQTRISRDTYTDRVTTTTYANNGSYNLAGNILTTTFRSTGRSSKDRIRFYQTRNIGSSEMFGNRIGDWQFKMGKLSLDGSVSGTVVYTKG